MPREKHVFGLIRTSFDAALLIYGDLCPLSPQQRSRLLSNVKRALKAGGHFVLDVTTPHLRQREGLKNSWYAVEAGFWRPGPHLVLQQGFSYPEDIYLDQYIVVETDGKISVYRNWFQDYTARTIRAELEAGGFIVQSLWSDLIGTPYEETSDWIGLVNLRGRGRRERYFHPRSRYRTTGHGYRGSLLQQ